MTTALTPHAEELIERARKREAPRVDLLALFFFFHLGKHGSFARPKERHVRFFFFASPTRYCAEEGTASTTSPARTARRWSSSTHRRVEASWVIDHGRHTQKRTDAS